MTFEEFAATLNITPENTPPSSYDLITDAYNIGYEAGKDSQHRFIERVEKLNDSLIKKYKALVDRYNKLGQFLKLEIEENKSLTIENEQLKKNSNCQKDWS